jgi:hypothetical protein
MSSLRCIVLLGLLGLVAMSSALASHRLDDAGTHAVPPNVQMQWRSVGAIGTGSARHMEALLTVAVRLDTRPHAGRVGRVFLVLPHDGGASLLAQWGTRGRLLPGRITPGERTLVYQGVIPHQTLEDQLTMALVADGAWMAGSRRLEFFFEVDFE